GFATGSTVTFGGAPAAVITQTASNISVATGLHSPGVVNVVVTNPDGQTATLVNGFTYLTPEITSVSPGSGSMIGGTVVNISGDGFLPGASVTFGGLAATNVSVLDATFITAAAPPHAAGTVDIVVTNPDSQTAMLAGGFTYVLPAITSVSP